MTVIVPTNTEVTAFEGLHLYHAGRSCCSARVRLLLEEKKLDWMSHHIDLYRRENITEEYFSINPKGLVPALVHDGRVIVESNDILLHLESTFPAPSFTPAAEADREKMNAWLQRSGDIHIPGIKTFAYARVHATNMDRDSAKTGLYRSLQTDPELLAFHGKHDADGPGFSENDVNAALELLDVAFRDMDDRLNDAPWLVGDDYSLADISWAPSITTLRDAGYRVEAFANVLEWYQRIAGRPAFRYAVTAWRENPIEGVANIEPGPD